MLVKVDFLITKFQSNPTFTECFHNHTENGLIKFNCYVNILNRQYYVINVGNVHVILLHITAY